ncbi:hypothetical protein [Gimesia aquarii]|uniref:YHS domain protein n=1 Tax=Gimesia aquarii TaxID=2527964 RepID=A0A517X007_9PLAN|nr:hypothetical protein [Gimesia aquarii]QDU10828.1 hypothetical protein V202x_42410 [Gimesia aquarii]
MRFTLPTAFCSAMTLAGMFCFAFVLFAEPPEEKKSSVSVKPKSVDSSRKTETQKASKKRLVFVEVAGVRNQHDYRWELFCLSCQQFFYNDAA